MPGHPLRPLSAPWVPQRLSLFFLVFVLVVLGLAARLANLGIIHGESYAQFSENNFLRKRTVDAPRGIIHDRNGAFLAYNRATYEVSMSPGNLPAHVIQTSLERVGHILNSDFSEHLSAVVKLRPRWNSRVLVRRLTLDQATMILEQRFALPGVSVEPRFERYYPWGSTLCHVLGHVGKITKAMWERRDRYYQEAGYEMDDDLGVVGLEAAFEEALRGQKGLEHVWETGRGRVLNSQLLEAPVPGHRLYLTIDLEFQRLAESLLLGQAGVILAINPQNGEILAWASSPTFDLNRPAAVDNPTSKPLLNRAIQEYYHPGSAFKVFTALAALEQGWPLERSVNCAHNFFLPSWSKPFRCLGWHGPLSFTQGFQFSCNVFFYTMADFVYRSDPQDAGYQLVRTAQRFGLGEPTGLLAAEGMRRVPGLEERSGRLPDLTSLRRERGSLLHLAIGQGRIDVTPLQMLLAYSALANGGELLVPHLVREVRTDQNELIFRAVKQVRRSLALVPEHRRAIIEGLLAVVNERGGTAANAGFLPEWRAAGKTSTAEIGDTGEPDAWFIGFAPAEKPQLAVVVLIERGGHGGKVAAPLAAKMMAHYFARPTLSQSAVASR
ncbi:MAG: penicillin-binding transpeptidase domain-containing protein [Candidatus Sumerlaeia bacterium]|nr:penicillin-binding transpeptidase domain-containing protein [Candidatus Sumerlaeia bacterium]